MILSKKTSCNITKKMTILNIKKPKRKPSQWFLKLAWLLAHNSVHEHVGGWQNEEKWSKQVGRKTQSFNANCQVKCFLWIAKHNVLGRKEKCSTGAKKTVKCGLLRQSRGGRRVITYPLLSEMWKQPQVKRRMVRCARGSTKLNILNGLVVQLT